VPRKNTYYQGPKSENFDGLRFHSPHEPPHKRPSEVLRMLAGHTRKPRLRSFPSPFEDAPPERVDHLRISFIGHASFLIQLSGLNILVDPVWADRVSPFTFAGPKRVNPPGIAFDDLPPIDAVLITHNHYDHLDGRTVARIFERFGSRIIAPLGNDPIIAAFNPDISVETHNWGDAIALSDRVRLHLAPAYHWSARALRDRRMALWCAYVITSSSGEVIYHIGDTAYGDGKIFRDIGATYGAPRVALLPIGAYEPRWYMKNQHVDPEDAVKIMLDCGAERAFGHHWGTFRLTQEPIGEPPQELARVLRAKGLAHDRFQALRPGQNVSLDWNGAWAPVDEAVREPSGEVAEGRG
jgi:L-ascorbate metabolism protein UlaG (beta-lactamase superfamily)